MTMTNEDLRALLAVRENVLGFCHSGTQRGMYITLEPWNPHRRSNFWDISFSATNDRFIAGDFTEFDFAQEENLDFLRRLDIEWAPSEPIARAVQAALFSNAEVEVMNAEIDPKATQPFGRFLLSQGLDRFVKHLTAHHEEIATWRDYAEPEILTELMARGVVQKSVDELSVALRAYGYTLAVVPMRDALVVDEHSPWAEFASQAGGA